MLLRTPRTRSLTSSLAVIAISTLSLTACSQLEIEEAAQKGLDKGSGFVVQRAAVAAGEALRGKLLQEANLAGISPERIELVSKVAAALPGVEVTVVDANGDGLDDDGRITVSTLGAFACLALPTLNSNGSTSAGAC
jgi:hypothetical protein